MFIGNQHLAEDFKKLIENGKLSHGYVFFGEPQVGKFTFARYLANFLESGEFDLPKKILSDSLAVNNSGKEGGIETMRGLKNFLFQKPVISEKRTIIIDRADELTPQAQNAILKITEEPSAHGLFILIVNHPENLLPPLLSRFQKIYFGRVSQKEIYDYLIKNYGLNNESAKNLAESSCGRIGRAVELINNGTLKQAKQAAEKFLKSQSFRRSEIIKNVVEIQKEKPEFLDYFMEFVIINLKSDPIKNHKTLKSALYRLFLIKSYNTNKRLQLEAI